MASDGHGDQQHHTARPPPDSEPLPARADTSLEADTPSEPPSTGLERPGQYSYDEGSPESAGYSDQPSSLTENLSQRVQDEVGAENERGAGDNDPDNYPLHSPWTFWFDRSSRAASAEDFFANLKKVCSIKTIKAFWCLYNNVTPVEGLQERESYHLMRGEERRPVWEDLNNIDGGFWAFKIRSEDTQRVWLELLLAAIGEQFSECMGEDDEICGISVKIRGFGSNTIQIWNVNSDQHSDSTVIKKIKSLIPPGIEINEYYQSSKSKMKEHVSKPPSSHPPYRGVSPPHHQRYGQSSMPHAPPMYPPHHHQHYGGRYPAPPMGAYPPPPHFRHAPPHPGGPRGYHAHHRPPVAYHHPPPS